MKKSTQKVFYFFLLFWLTSATVYAQAKLKIFEGTWAMKEEGGGTMFEEWNKVSDSLYKGESYAISENKKQVFETVSLKYVDGKLCYAPTVNDQNQGKEVLFTLKENSDGGKKFVFENLQHDFPQRIIYHFKTEKTLDARIEGTAGGKEKFSDYHFVKK
ncbi:MAG TPA: DUF6265 family protein [Bacteroidia bacterium]|nr:DUF6265 family protein [Bacteroidia bacterium]